MFTFYDDVYKDEEKVWNLCFNELLDKFITFYSWLPSYSENIDTQFFTFDRRTSKWLTLLNKCNYNIPENDGILVDIPVLNTYNSQATLYYRNPDITRRSYKTVLNPDGTTYNKVIVNVKEDNNPLDNGIVEGVSYRIEKDHWGNWKQVTLNGNKIKFKSNIFTKSNPVRTLLITPIVPCKDGITGIETVTECRGYEPSVNQYSQGWQSASSGFDGWLCRLEPECI